MTEQYEIWVTQGLGGYCVEKFDSLESAKEYAQRTGAGVSIGIKLPDGSWYDWSKDT